MEEGNSEHKPARPTTKKLDMTLFQKYMGPHYVHRKN